jgi:hypothetical protein
VITFDRIAHDYGHIDRQQFLSACQRQSACSRPRPRVILTTPLAASPAIEREGGHEIEGYENPVHLTQVPEIDGKRTEPSLSAAAALERIGTGWG